MVLSLLFFANDDYCGKLNSRPKAKAREGGKRHTLVKEEEGFWR